MVVGWRKVERLNSSIEIDSHTYGVDWLSRSFTAFKPQRSSQYELSLYTKLCIDCGPLRRIPEPLL